MKKGVAIGIAIGIAVVIIMSSILIIIASPNTESNQEPIVNPTPPPGKDLRIDLSESVGVGENP